MSPSVGGPVEVTEPDGDGLPAGRGGFVQRQFDDRFTALERVRDRRDRSRTLRPVHRRPCSPAAQSISELVGHTVSQEGVPPWLYGSRRATVVELSRRAVALVRDARLRISIGACVAGEFRDAVLAVPELGGVECPAVRAGGVVIARLSGAFGRRRSAAPSRLGGARHSRAAVEVPEDEKLGNRECEHGSVDPYLGPHCGYEIRSGNTKPLCQSPYRPVLVRLRATLTRTGRVSYTERTASRVPLTIELAPRSLLAVRFLRSLASATPPLSVGYS